MHIVFNGDVISTKILIAIPSESAAIFERRKSTITVQDYENYRHLESQIRLSAILIRQKHICPPISKFKILMLYFSII